MARQRQVQKQIPDGNDKERQQSKKEEADSSLRCGMTKRGDDGWLGAFLGDDRHHIP
jgi:hypothetical protein